MLLAPTNSYKFRVYDDMTTLCEMFCPDDLKQEINALRRPSENQASDLPHPGTDGPDEEEEEEEEEEKEELE